MIDERVAVMQENFEDLLDDFMGSSKEGHVVKGRVVSVRNDVVIVDVGLKAEGRIALREFASPGRPADVKEGDEVDVYVERMEGHTGETVLSRERARREEAWLGLESKCRAGKQVEGMIVGRVRGGFTVQLDSVQAFLPGSQIDIRPIQDVAPIMHCVQPFQILSMDKERGNIVVSRRAVLEESRVSQRNELMEKLREDQVIEGVVKNITPYGAFIDLGGLDGLLHITDMSWRRLNHPSELLKIGETIKVKIIRFDMEKRRISLGVKQLEEDPWLKALEHYSVGSRHTGRITNITDYGAFIELQEGVEGLVHVSEMSWTKKNFLPSTKFSTSQEVEVMVLEVDTDKRRVSLGIKQCMENPWEKFAAHHKVGEVYSGIINNITEFGMFIDLGDDIYGMVHVSDLVWGKSGDDELKSYNKGDKVEVKLLDFNIEKERISLGIKQLSDDPVAMELSRISVGDIVTATVTKVSHKGVDVDVGGIPGFIGKNNLSRDKADQRGDRFAEGEKIDAQVLKMDNNSLVLSVKAHEVAEEKAAMQAYGSSDSGASLGDILGAALRRKQGDESDVADATAMSDAEQAAPKSKAKTKVKAKAKAKAKSKATAKSAKSEKSEHKTSEATDEDKNDTATDA